MTPAPNVNIPQDENAERGVIGSVLVLPELIDELIARVSGGDFFYLRARETWQAMVSLQAKGDAIDETTVLIELKARGIEGVDDEWLIGCRNLAADSPPAAMKYADTVRQYAIRLRVMKAARELVEQAANLSKPLDTVLAQHAAALEVLPGPAHTSRTLAQAYGAVFEEYGKPAPRGLLTTGIAALDDKLRGGMRGGKLAILAARTSMGKTAVLLHMAHTLAGKGIPVGFISLEMDDSEIMDRLTAIESRVPQVSLRTNLATEQQTAITRAHMKFTVTTFGNNFHMVYDGGMTMERIRALAATWARQGVRAVFVDYLQLIESGGLFRPSERTAEIGYYSRSLKRIALAHDIAVIAAAQLNREPEKRADKKPLLSDMRESGSLEQDADIAILLNRRGVYDEAVDPRVLDLDVAKQRAGATGMVNAWLELETGRVLPSKTVTVNLRDITEGKSA